MNEAANDSIVDPTEARLVLFDMCRTKKGTLPAQLLADHVLHIYGAADWAVQRAAMEAILRRARFGREDQLKVAERPKGGAPLGEYRTRRRRGSLRPYRTVLRGLRPLEASCDCPDFLRGSLGVCKHVLAVLGDLAGRPRKLQQAAVAGSAGGPALTWDPVRPLRGEGDWLAQVHLRPANGHRRGRSIDAVSKWFDPEGRPKAVFPDKPAKRLALVTALEGAVRSARPKDPALTALLQREHGRLDRVMVDRKALGRAKRALRSMRQPLYPYQVEGIERFLRTGRLLLADDMGLGKTAQAIGAAHALWRTGRARRGLIIVPASLRYQWEREWHAFTDVPLQVVDGGPEERHRLYRARGEGFLVTSYRAVLRDLEAMIAYQPDMVILDEAQRIKNWATKTAAYIKRIDAPNRLVLTGTPLENRLDELASIMDWVDDHALEPKWRLGPVHSMMADGSNEVVGVRGLDTLRQRLAPSMVRRTRPEILTQLPPRTDTVIPLELTPEQREAHDDLIPPISRLLHTARRRPLRQAEFLRLMSLLTTQRIIANGLAQLEFTTVWPSISSKRPDEPRLRGLFSPKLLELREIVRRIVVEQERKIVVFSQWRRMLMLASWAVGDLLEQHGLRAAFFTGKEGRRRREQNIVDFHDDPNTRILFATDAGGVGLNLQRAASCIVNLELPWNPAVLEQRVGRIYRLGQEAPIDVFNLVSRDCIEERIAQSVAGKQALFTGLFDGESDEVRFDTASSFLSRLEQVVDVAPAPDRSEDQDSDPSADREIETVLAAADESQDVSAAETVQPSNGLPPPDEVRRLFGGIEIRPREDGGLHIEASAEAAATLGALFEGMASLLRQGEQPAKR